jgi:type VI secretion system protein ImpL
MLNFLQKIFLSRVLVMLVGGLVAGVLIWFVGPLLGAGGAHPLDSEVHRAFAMALLPAIGGISYGLISWRDRRLNGQMATAVAGGPANAEHEVNELSNRLKEALGILKQSRFGGSAGRRYLYQLPWYMFIGPSGSGKTTALTNSGLNFPLSEKFGRSAVQGVGGTRSCDWWFTDQAVLIDTAGRYTSQDSEAAQDKAAWLGFLKLLKRFRKRQPLNGVFVAIGLSDLTAAGDAERQEHAHQIRRRINELYVELGVKLPVYVLFTKSDLIAGFVEFFDDLGRDGREAVWGLTFDYQVPEPPDGYAPLYRAEFDALVGRADERLLERLQTENDIQRRSLVFGFPQQFASLRDVTERFLQEAFRPNRYEQPILLRGVYFTSGTQAGTPIDRLMGAMATTFGMPRQALSAAAGSGRSYFLNKLLLDVVFGEAGLVESDPRVERRRRLLRQAAYGLAGALVLILSGLWLTSYLGNRALIANVDSIAAAYRDKAKTLQLDHVTDADPRPVLPLLDTLRDLPGGYAQRHRPVSLWLEFGLYQGDKIGAQATASYQHALGAVLLPRLILRLENQIAANQNNPDFLYAALKVYLMLGQQGPLDKELIRHWESLDWTAEFPGADNDALRQSLSGHLDALLAAPWPNVGLSAELVGRSRDILNRLPLSERAYSLLKTEPKATALPDWRIADNAGPAAPRVFQRASGKPLSAGIPGLFTHDGFYSVFVPLLPSIAKEVAKDGWVLGTDAPVTDDPATVARLQHDVTALYLDDFAQQWDRLLADVAVTPFGTVNQALQSLGALSAPDSPAKLLLASAARETMLSKPPAAPAPANPAPGNDRLAGLLGAVGQEPGGVVDTAARFTDQHFKPLFDLVNPVGGGPQPIDTVIGSLGELYRAMTKLGTAPDQGSPLARAAGNPAGELQASAGQYAEPLKSWVQSVAKSSASLSLGGARSQIANLWAAIGPFCHSATDNRYPFGKAASSEVTPDDFTKLFAPGGQIDAFFAANLRQFVDMSAEPWRWQKLDNADLGLSAATLIQFERAAKLRDGMFAGGKPSLSVEFLPVSLDPGSSKVTLDIDGQTIVFDRSAPHPVRIQWPSPNGVAGARLGFDAANGGAPAMLTATGAWSLFRLLDQGQVRPAGGADRFAVTFTVGSHSASFEMRATSVVNPFAGDALGQFRCPGGL